MAFTINGIGTTHVTRRNKSEHSGVCDQCGRSAILRSYDTLYAFCIIFIPIIPLRRLRINKHCNRCDRFYQTPLKRWKRDVDEANELLVSGLGDAPNRDVIIQGLIRIIVLHALETLNRHIDEIDTTFKQDAEIQALLATTLLNFGEYQRAYNFAILAFGLEKSDENRELVAIVAMNTGRVDEARAGLQFVLSKSVDEKLPQMLVLVECYQEQGRHEDALGLLDDIVHAFPSNTDHRDSRRLRKISEKHRATGKPVRSRIMAGRSRGGINRGAIAATILLIAAVVGLIVLVIPLNSPTYFVNGLPKDYTVEIDGDAYVLPAGELVPIPLSNGPHLARVIDGELGIADVEFDVHINPLERFVDRKVYVVNPDTFGYVYWEHIPYSQLSGPEIDELYKTELHTDESVFVFEEIDYVFKDSPDEIDIGFEDTTMKKALSNYSSPDYYETAEYIGENESEERLLDYLDLVLKQDAADEFLPDITNYYLSPKVAIDILEPTLDRYLDNVNYHRGYQNVAQHVYTTDDLAQQYRRYVEQDPGNADLLYLLGRTGSNPPADMQMYELSY